MTVLLILKDKAVRAEALDYGSLNVVRAIYSLMFLLNGFVSLAIHLIVFSNTLCNMNYFITKVLLSPVPCLFFL